VFQLKLSVFAQVLTMQVVSYQCSALGITDWSVLMMLGMGSRMVCDEVLIVESSEV
jgi:hypothetical protein